MVDILECLLIFLEVATFEDFSSETVQVNRTLLKHSDTCENIKPKSCTVIGIVNLKQFFQRGIVHISIVENKQEKLQSTYFVL